MADKTSCVRTKRLPKSQRIHIRRMKAAARKAGATLPAIAYQQPATLEDKGGRYEKPGGGVD